MSDEIEIPQEAIDGARSKGWTWGLIVGIVNGLTTVAVTGFTGFCGTCCPLFGSFVGVIVSVPQIGFAVVAGFLAALLAPWNLIPRGAGFKMGALTALRASVITSMFGSGGAVLGGFLAPIVTGGAIAASNDPGKGDAAGGIMIIAGTNAAINCGVSLASMLPGILFAVLAGLAASAFRRQVA